MSVEAYITVHDQELLLACETSGQFDCMDHTYLFVGPRPITCDIYGVNADVIVARDYEPNFEHMPSTYDFSGWWAVAHHDLIDADLVILLQYDMRINDPDIGDRCRALVESAPAPIAFTAGHRSADNWMLLLPGFRETFEEGMHVLGVDTTTWDLFDEWPSTQGMAWPVGQFRQFMEWVTPLFDLWHGNVWHGHLMERTVKAWCAHTGTTEQYLHGVIMHENRDCHGTCALMGGRTEVHAERAATFGR